MLQEIMPTILSRYTELSDGQLLDEVRLLVERERHATAQLIASLAELDGRRLYLGEGYSSLFTYCTQALHLSEHAAYGRIAAARAAKRFPVILDLLVDGSITVTTVRLLAPHLTNETTLRSWLLRDIRVNVRSSASWPRSHRSSTPFS